MSYHLELQGGTAYCILSLLLVHPRSNCGPSWAIAGCAFYTSTLFWCTHARPCPTRCALSFPRGPGLLPASFKGGQAGRPVLATRCRLCYTRAFFIPLCPASSPAAGLSVVCCLSCYSLLSVHPMSSAGLSVVCCLLWCVLGLLSVSCLLSLYLSPFVCCPLLVLGCYLSLCSLPLSLFLCRWPALCSLSLSLSSPLPVVVLATATYHLSTLCLLSASHWPAMPGYCLASVLLLATALHCMRCYRPQPGLRPATGCYPATLGTLIGPLPASLATC